MNEQPRLEEIYEQWSTERLLKALEIEAEQYRPDALPVMRRVLESRGLPDAEVQARTSDLQSEQQSEDRRLARMRGWLLVFIAIVGLNALSELGMALVAAASDAHWTFRVVAVLFSTVALYGLYSMYLLVRRRSSAPAHARRWILLSFVATAIWAVISYAVAGAGVVDLTVLLGPAFFMAVWIAYLSESKRVAAVYGMKTEKIEANVL